VKADAVALAVEEQGHEVCFRRDLRARQYHLAAGRLEDHLATARGEL